MSKTLATLADRMLAKLAPQATASASTGWYLSCRCTSEGVWYQYCTAVPGVGTKCTPCNILRKS